MSNESVENLFEFVVEKLPNLFIDMTASIFTPLESVIGSNGSDFILGVYDLITLHNPLFNFIKTDFIEPIFDFGLIGLFSVSSLVMIIIFKVIDLVIPV